VKRATLALVFFALLVNAPRFVLVFLRADSLALGKQIEAGLLILTAIATGCVLSGGGAVIAHTLAKHKHGGRWRQALAAIWLAMLAFSVVLIAPLMVAGIRSSDLAAVLDSPAWQWGWSIVAVLAVEVLAAGAMIANALADEPLAVTEQAAIVLEQPSIAPAIEAPASIEEQAPQERGQEEASFRCFYCTATFGTRQALGAHSRKHRNEQSGSFAVVSGMAAD
jgi:hypothetical protein